MIKKLKLSSIYLTLSVVLLSTQGCAALLIGAVAGAGTVTYLQGELKQNVDAPLQKAHKAAVKALADNKIFIFNDVLTSKDASLNGEYADGTKVRVSITSLTPNASSIHIRVGKVGDEEKSIAIMDKILNHL